MSVMNYHKLVKTTPNPSATKKSSGELLEPDSLEPVLGGVVDEGVGVVAIVGGRCVAAQQHNEFGVCGSTPVSQSVRNGRQSS
ncbi:hypothetical protein FQN49_008670, partial [Arthroderma sp. PD_2]